jgi:hypothetical protein
MKNETAEILAEIKRQYKLSGEAFISEKTFLKVRKERLRRRERVLEKLDNIEKALCRLERLVRRIETIAKESSSGVGHS